MFVSRLGLVTGNIVCLRSELHVSPFDLVLHVLPVHLLTMSVDP